MREANDYLRSANVVRWPTEKVFNQPQDSDLNTFDVALRFQDVESSSLLRIRSEQVTFRAELDRNFVEDDIKVEKQRVVVDFDRAAFNLPADKFRADEWVTGCFHVLRRDFAKVI